MTGARQLRQETAQPALMADQDDRASILEIGLRRANENVQSRHWVAARLGRPRRDSDRAQPASASRDNSPSHRCRARDSPPPRPGPGPCHRSRRTSDAILGAPCAERHPQARHERPHPGMPRPRRAGESRPQRKSTRSSPPSGSKRPVAVPPTARPPEPPAGERAASAAAARGRSLELENATLLVLIG